MFSTYHTHLAESMGTWSESPSGPALVLVHTCTSTIPYKVLSDYFWAAYGSDSRAFPCRASFGIFHFAPSSYFCWLWQQTTETPSMLPPQTEGHEAVQGADTNSQTHPQSIRATLCCLSDVPWAPKWSCQGLLILTDFQQNHRNSRPTKTKMGTLSWEWLSSFPQSHFLWTFGRRLHSLLPPRNVPF